MRRLRLFQASTLDETLAASRRGPRRRANFNVHPALDDPIQRMLNIFQPGSYVRPHRHDPDRFELFLILAGKAAVLTFADDGRVEEAAVLAPGAAWAVEIPGGVGHTVFALAPDTVMFEVKPGPYHPLAENDFAPWAPPAGTPEAQKALKEWERGVLARPQGPVEHGRG